MVSTPSKQILGCKPKLPDRPWGHALRHVSVKICKARWKGPTPSFVNPEADIFHCPCKLLGFARFDVAEAIHDRPPRHTKVSQVYNLRSGPPMDQKVGWLDIAMHDVLPMQVSQAIDLE
jgi:hypothetical protein